MQAIVAIAAGDLAVLQLQDVPEPQISLPDRVKIRLKAAGINPIDTKLRQRGTFYSKQMPAVLGCDGAGVVEAVGPAVERFRVGDAVYFCQGGLGRSHTGNYAQYAVVDSHFLAPKPQRLSFAAAAAAPLVLITAWEALYDRARLRAGQTVLIHGGTGGVGHVAVQLARLRGARVAATVGTPEKAAIARDLGVELPILYKETDFVAAIREWTDGAGVDVAFDTVGGALLEQTFPAVKLYGDIVTILSPAANTNWKEARDRNLRVSLELMLTPQLRDDFAAQEHQAQILADCTRLFERDELKLLLHQTFPLAEAATAHACLANGSVVGKLALVVP